jgi:hypothetical protein
MDIQHIPVQTQQNTQKKMTNEDFKPLFIKASDNMFYIFIRKLESWEDKGKYNKWLEDNKWTQKIQLEEANETNGWNKKQYWAVYQQVSINAWIQADYEMRYIYDPIGGRIEPYHLFDDNNIIVDEDELDTDYEDVE